MRLEPGSLRPKAEGQRPKGEGRRPNVVDIWLSDLNFVMRLTSFCVSPVKVEATLCSLSRNLRSCCFKMFDTLLVCLGISHSVSCEKLVLVNICEAVLKVEAELCSLEVRCTCVGLWGFMRTHLSMLAAGCWNLRSCCFRIGDAVGAWASTPHPMRSAARHAFTSNLERDMRHDGGTCDRSTSCDPIIQAFSWRQAKRDVTCRV